MRVLVFGFSSQMGGVESFLLNYCLAMSEIDPDIRFDFVVIDKIPPFVNTLQDKGFDFHVVPNRMSHPLGYSRALTNIIKTGNYDCLWYNTCTLSDITLLRKASKSIPVRIEHAHAAAPMGNPINGLLHRIHKASLEKYATHFFACSEEGAAFMFPNPVLASHKWRFVPNGIDAARYVRNESEMQTIRDHLHLGQRPVFGHVGRFSKEKNHPFLLRVFARIKEVLPSATLLLIGDGQEEGEVKEMAIELGLESSVRFLGSRQDVPSLLKAMDVFLFPSEHEGFGLALIEAQATGLECIASTGIPKNAIVTPRAQRLPLDEEMWCQEAIDAYERAQCSHESLPESVTRAGFDIHDNAKRLLTYLKEELDRTTWQDDRTAR